MKTIGRMLACALLAHLLAKNVLATSAANVESPKGQSNVTDRSGATTEPRPFPRSYPADRDVPGDVSDESENDESDVGFEGSRTFGHKRLQFMLMPMMYKMGAMMTMLMVLIAITAKGLVIGIVLLVLKLSAFLSKFHSWHHEHASSPWSSHQPIHVHVHNSLPYAHSQAYHGWESASGPGSEDHYYYKG